MSASPEPESRVVTAIDYDVVFARGGDRQWTLFPHLGDTEEATDDTLIFTLGRTQHRVTVYRREIAVLSRREREVHVPLPKFEPRIPVDAREGETREIRVPANRR
jgi:hypothetical protein